VTSPRDETAARWLILIHQIPPKPAYLRQKVGRRLARVGAVAIKNSVYVIPLSEQTQEDLQWLAREISTEGGEATICSAHFIDGLRDDQVEALFHAARDAEYAALAEEARGVARGLPSRLGREDERRAGLEVQLGRLRKRLEEIVAIDFFGSSGRESARAAIDGLERRLQRQTPPSDAGGRLAVEEYRGRVWVTRKNVHIDRIASAWLIQRFIDPEAQFKFVAGHDYRALPEELTFDMSAGTFTHVGDRCTFETLLQAFELREPGLSSIAEIIHDIDVKDAKFERPEVAGVAAVIGGIALCQSEDEARIALGGGVFDGLLRVFRRKRGVVE
jgi:hypothetical protein